MKRILSGNEAVAQGAWEAGCTVASGYPGTPSTEILENFAQFPGVYSEWAPNEKVALESAAGAAFAGKRSITTMKHVGLNVAADPLFAVAETGIEAGMVIVSADDPSMHSSQNEQDNRQYARFARIPCLEPSDSQEARDFAIAAFDLSERFDTPVMLRMTTRTSHTSSPVKISEQRRILAEPGPFPRNVPKYVTMPNNARKRHLVTEERIRQLVDFAETYELNRVEKRSSKLGIITAGISYQYAREVFPEASVLKLGMVYPLPYHLIKNFAKSVEKVIVLEELDPFIENIVRLMGVQLYEGPQDQSEVVYPNKKTIFPIFYELDPLVVRKSAEKAGLLEPTGNPPEPAALELPARPPTLCPGCPHRSTFYVLSKLKVPVSGDIGCYTLGVMPPTASLHTCLCMGASISVAHGASVAGSKERHFAVIGDSTFMHTGIQSLMNVVYNRSNVITVILDNRITGMTGHQENPATGKTLQRQDTYAVDLEAIVRALGVQHVKVVEGYDVKTIESTLKEWMKLDEPAVLISREECALLPTARKRWRPLKVSENCNGCTLCFRVGCPAILKSEERDEKFDRPKAKIDPTLCTGCEICARICPRDAIYFRAQMDEQEKA